MSEEKTRADYFSYKLRTPEAHLILRGRNIPFINHGKYLGVIFDKRITWRLRIGIIKAKVFRPFFRIYFLFKSERLSANIKLTVHKAPSLSVLTYACSASEFSAHTQLMKLQPCKTRFSATLVNFQGVHRSASCTWLSTYRIFKTT
jgi:hypothetical protein